jgi:hypothetical protein
MHPKQHAGKPLEFKVGDKSKSIKLVANDEGMEKGNG